MKDEKWWALAHEWYRDIIKVARTAVWYREGDYGFRTGPSIFAQDDKPIDIKTRRESTSFGWVKTGSRTSEDFRQQDWFQVGDEKPIDIKHLREGGDNGVTFIFDSTSFGRVKTGGRTSEDFRQEDWFRVGPPDAKRLSGDWGTIKHLRSGDWGFKAGDFYRTWPTIRANIKHLFDGDDSGSMTIRNRKTGPIDPNITDPWVRVGGDGEGGYVPWNRLAHTCPF